MKKVLFLVYTLLFALGTYGQCNLGALIGNCAAVHDSGGYTYIRTFGVETKQTSSESLYSVVFNKDHEYLIIICQNDDDNSENKMIVNLLDRNQELIQSSYYEPLDTHVSMIRFRCTATGVYFFQSFFEEDDDSCGAIILSFKKITD